MSSLSNFFILLVVLLAISTKPGRAKNDYVPEDFACTKDKPSKSGEYSSVPAQMKIKVDLIPIFCWQVYGGKGHGFHARPGDKDPESASTTVMNQIRKPQDKYDFAVYHRPQINDNGKDVAKNGISGIWPTTWSMEKVAQAIATLDYKCR